MFYYKEDKAWKNAGRSDISQVTLKTVMEGLNERYGIDHACYHFKVDDATHNRALEGRIKEEWAAIP